MDYYDLICVGGGPTSLTAALYAAREGLDVLVIEKSGLGGQAGVTERLDNFPGFPEGIGGAEFADRLTQQARRFGVELLQAQEVTNLRAEAESRYVTTADGREYGARAVLIATGSTYKRLGVPGEEELIGAGVHFCATCDGPFYKGKHVAVIGGGNSAGEESIFLTRFADKVSILVRGEAMTASQIVIEKIAENPKIELRTNTEVTKLHGEHKLSGISIRNRSTGAAERLDPAGIFVFIGLSPNSGWLPDSIKRDPYGFVETNATLETSVPGIFAAGDVRKGSTKQAASAAGEGATVALMVREYLKGV
jgi:thioredoxin reductase (NADPH)